MSAPEDPRVARARAWRDASHVAVCDALTPWAGGTVVRASRYPTYWYYNAVRVERDTGMSCAELIAFADEALDGLAHRKIDFDDVAQAERLRGEFDAADWQSRRLVLMRHETATSLSSPHTVEEVPFDATEPLRVAWHNEDFPGVPPDRHLEDERELAGRRGDRILAVVEAGNAVGFSQLLTSGTAAEVTDVYVDSVHRGAGIGTALTLGAIELAAGAQDLWILADDEDRPKELYKRLGFRPVWCFMRFLRLPHARS